MSKVLNLSDKKEPAPKATGVKKQKKQTAPKPRRRWIAATALAAVLFAVVASSGLAVAHYSDKILPGVNVSGVSLGGKTRPQAEALLQQDVAKLSIVIQNNQTTWKPTPEQLGISYDIPATVTSAYSEGRTGAVGQRLGALSGVGVPFVVHYNSAVTDSYISSIVHATSKEPADATLKVKGGTVQIVPETIGQTTGVEDAARRIRSVLGRPAPLSLTVSEITLQPKITAAYLQEPLAQAQNMVQIPVTITSNGKNFAPTIAQKAGWLDFTPDTANHTQKVSFDSAKIQGFVASVVKSLTVQPQPQEIGVNLDENGAQSVIQQGQNGQTVGNAAALSSGLLAALTAGQPFTGAVTTSVVPFGVKHMNIYDRWIEVNLSTQRMTAWQKGTSVLSVLISSGISLFPTPTGTFHIYGKSRVTEMKGELGTPFAYDLPNVQWVSWWMGSYSIHGTYWHHNFGHVMSHGCINATNADAQFIYNWAPVGTAVVIHR